MDDKKNNLDIFKKPRSYLWPRLKRRFLSNAWLVRSLMILFFLATTTLILTLISRPVLNIAARLWVGPRLVKGFFVNPETVLMSNDSRVNILLLGISGGNHAGKDLTDTMIFVSIKLDSGDVAILSLPRDIWLDSLKAKINTAYHYGQEKNNSGFALVKDAVYQITGQPIHYAFLLDFAGFVKAVDLVGGIDVEVERAFRDNKYPIAGKENDACNGDLKLGCRFETITFDKGRQHFDGNMALKFVRSRNAEGEEGTDFSRSQRQQKVILAFKNKLLSTQTLLSPQRLVQLKLTLSKNLKMDKNLSVEEMAAFINLFWNFIQNKNQLRTLSVDTGSEENPGFLINPPIDQYGQWILLPRSGSWDEFQEFLEQKFKYGI